MPKLVIIWELLYCWPIREKNEILDKMYLHFYTSVGNTKFHMAEAEVVKNQLGYSTKLER